MWGPEGVYQLKRIRASSITICQVFPSSVELFISFLLCVCSSQAGKTHLPRHAAAGWRADARKGWSSCHGCARLWAMPAAAGTRVTHCPAGSVLGAGRAFPAGGCSPQQALLSVLWASLVIVLFPLLSVTLIMRMTFWLKNYIFKALVSMWWEFNPNPSCLTEDNNTENTVFERERHQVCQQLCLLCLGASRCSLPLTSILNVTLAFKSLVT